MFRRLFPTRWARAYRRLREPKAESDLVLDEPAIEDALRASPISVTEIVLDAEDEREWVAGAEYATRYPNYYPGNLHEKTLEHYLAAKILALAPGEIFVDIASQNGVAAEIYERLYGVTAYAQDLDFEPGLHGRRIGGDAGAMPLPDGFADAMALHCSFEHFEGASDMAFVAEAGRVLKPGGRCVVAPLYLANRYCCLTDPRVAARERVAFEEDMLVVALRTYGNRHGRFYDVAHLVERVWNRRGPLDVSVAIVRGFRDVHPSCYLRYALILHKPPTRAT